MEIEFEAAKDAENRRKHGISLGRAVDFDLASSLLKFDDREQYGEDRYIATGFLDTKLYVLVFMPSPTTVRVSSLRKATREESVEYAEGT